MRRTTVLALTAAIAFTTSPSGQSDFVFPVTRPELAAA